MKKRNRKLLWDAVTSPSANILDYSEYDLPSQEQLDKYKRYLSVICENLTHEGEYTEDARYLRDQWLNDSPNGRTHSYLLIISGRYDFCHWKSVYDEAIKNEVKTKSLREFFDTHPEIKKIDTKEGYHPKPNKRKKSKTSKEYESEINSLRKSVSEFQEILDLKTDVEIIELSLVFLDVKLEKPIDPLVDESWDYLEEYKQSNSSTVFKLLDKNMKALREKYPSLLQSIL